MQNKACSLCRIVRGKRGQIPRRGKILYVLFFLSHNAAAFEMEQQQKDYTAVPPPSNLTGSSAPVDFNDALSKARAIAEKLKQQQAGNGGPSATGSAKTMLGFYLIQFLNRQLAGSKRGYQEESYHDDSRDYSSRSYESRDHYGDRETKRGMYESNCMSFPLRYEGFCSIARIDVILS